MNRTTRSRSIIGSVVLVYFLMLVTGLPAQTIRPKFDEQFSHWPVELTMNGRIVIENGIQETSDLQPIFERFAKGKTAICFRRETDATANSLLETLTTAAGDEGRVDIKAFTSLPTDDVKTALAAADIVVIQSGDGPEKDLTSLLKLKTQLDAFLAKGNTLVVDMPVATLLGKHVIQGMLPDENNAGLNLVFDSILEDFSGPDASQAALLKTVARYPATVGIGLERETLLVVSGRRVTCFGTGKATFVLAGCEHLPPRIETILPVRKGQPIQDSLVDLTEWRRDAIDRTLEPFPPAEPKTPFVENGTLMIVGGGRMPKGMMEQFVELAGGAENARLVYVPCLEGPDAGDNHGMIRTWNQMKVKQATFIHTKDRNRANSDDEFLEPLKDATGIWFGGGRQWNFSDSYYGTKAHRLMKEVLHRGGVIGGSSAGASIQARYLARGTPIGNTRIMAPGYERGGLGFLSGVAIDQHFSQRKRQADMTQLIGRYPQLLGIGLDEATAIIVEKSKAEVVGEGKVFFYDSKRKAPEDQPDYIALPAGSRYDLAERTVLVDATKTEAENEAKPAEKTPNGK